MGDFVPHHSNKVCHVLFVLSLTINEALVGEVCICMYVFVGSIFEFQHKIQEAKHCLIRQHAHTPGRVIGLLCGVDVKSLTELHAAMTQITENVTEPKPQWHKHLHQERTRIITVGTAASRL